MGVRRRQSGQGEASEDRKSIERQRFNALVALCESPRCRRQTLLAYFGEESGPCGHCDLCQDDVARFDATVETQKAMSAMARTGQRFGTEHLVQILLGNATDAILRLEHDRLPTFGVGKDRDAHRSEEHTSELQSLMRISYAVFCLKKQKTQPTTISMIH